MKEVVMAAGLLDEHFGWEKSLDAVCNCGLGKTVKLVESAEALSYHCSGLWSSPFCSCEMVLW